MGDVLIISDLHLNEERPETVDLFLHFLGDTVATAQALYILGDLFDAWIGDDDHSPPIPSVVKALRQASDNGTRIYLMHGNRDFLLGERFAAATGCRLLQDPSVVSLAGAPTLLMHGDLLCTDDVDYQRARKMLRSAVFIEEFLNRPLQERRHLAQAYRKQSGEAISLKASEIMDVNQQTVERYMRERGVSRLVHGHTHRPGGHSFQLDGKTAHRFVLGEWHGKRGNYLRANTGLTSVELGG
jgi:UDP-2,3-diacylglucosamine hydrolase